MRVALLTNNGFPPREGVARHVLELAVRLKGRGIDPLIVAKGTRLHGWQDMIVQGVTVRLFPYLGLRPFHQALLKHTLQRWLDQGAGGSDIIHAHLPLLPALNYPTPPVVTVHSPLATDTAAISERDWRAHLIKLNARLISRHSEQWHLDHAARLIAVSRGVAHELASHYELNGRTAEVITNGVDTGFFAHATRALRERRLVYVGRLGYRKGLGRLLEALALVGDQRLGLDLVGEGPLEETLRRQVQKLGLDDRVRFIGFLDRGLLRERLSTAAALINPADYESGPLTLLEAMACGTPVISTPTGLACELGDDPPVLIARPTAQSLAAAIDRLMAEQGETLSRAAAARQLVEQRFDWERICDRLMSLYTEPQRLAA